MTRERVEFFSRFFIGIIFINVLFNLFLKDCFYYNVIDKEKTRILTEEEIIAGSKDFEYKDKELISTSADPWINIKMDSKEASEINIAVDSLENYDFTKIYFAVEREDYEENNGISVSLHEGQNSIKLPENTRISKLRLDLASKVGAKIKLSQISLISFETKDFYWFILCGVSLLYIIFYILKIKFNLVNKISSLIKKYTIKFWIISDAFVFLLGIILAKFELFFAVTAVLILGSMLFGTYYVVYLIIKYFGVIDFIKKLNKKEKIGIVISIVVINIIVLAQVTKSNTILYWDYSNYWKLTINFTNMIFTSPIEAMRNLLYSINNSLYNYFIPALLALPVKVLGNEFVIFVMLTLNLFLLPATFINVVIGYKLSAKTSKPNFAFIWFIISLLPVYIMPVMNGFPDAFSFLMISLFILMITDNLFVKFDFKTCVLSSIVLILSVIGRRYFPFVVLAMGASIVLLFLIKLIEGKCDRKELILNFSKNSAVIITVVTVLFLILFRDMFINFVSSNIKEIYIGYKKRFLSEIKLLVELIGRGISVIYAVGAFSMLFNKKTRKFTIFMISSIIITILTFFSIQVMVSHQIYTIAMFTIIFISYLLIEMYNIKFSKIFYIATIIILLLDIAQGFKVLNMNKCSMLSLQYYNENERNDMLAIYSMGIDLYRECGKSDLVYVLSSSSILNSDVVRNTFLPDMEFKNVWDTCNVDLVDGFPVGLFNAKYVVVCDPIQYHLLPKYQKNIGILAEDFLNGGVISKNYEFIREYTLDKGVKAKVYKKTKEIDMEQKKYLISAFDSYYSEYPKLFRDRIEKLKVQ